MIQLFFFTRLRLYTRVGGASPLILGYSRSRVKKGTLTIHQKALEIIEIPMAIARPRCWCILGAAPGAVSFLHKKSARIWSQTWCRAFVRRVRSLVQTDVIPILPVPLVIQQLHHCSTPKIRHSRNEFCTFSVAFG